VIEEVALPALGLVGHAFLVDLLVFRRQRRLLRRPERLVRIELHPLAAQPRIDGVPLAFPIGVFRLVGGLRNVHGRHERGGQRPHANQVAMLHDVLPVLSHAFLVRDGRDKSGEGYNAPPANGTDRSFVRAAKVPAHALPCR
jgi:hypothetical protein